MAKTTEQTNKKDAPKGVKASFWLIETTFRAFVGWALLSNFHNLFTTIAGVYALATALILVVINFFNAHK